MKSASELWMYENRYFDRGVEKIAGTDEAGRGPLAGPVYAAAVILPRGEAIDGLDDSKKLSEKKRELLYDIITARAESWCVASASVAEIETLNILGASMLAMRRALNGLALTPGLVLVDGTVARDFPCEAVCIAGGDGKSANIAAASILAKVSRDRYMKALSEKYPQYGFEKHKGYGTQEHVEALRAFGPCPEHRPLFLRKILP